VSPSSRGKLTLLLTVALALLACALPGVGVARAEGTGAGLTESIAARLDELAAPAKGALLPFNGSAAEVEHWMQYWRPWEAASVTRTKGTDTAEGWVPRETKYGYSGAYNTVGTSKLGVPEAALAELAAAPEGGSVSVRLTSYSSYYAAKLTKESGNTYSVQLVRRIRYNKPVVLASTTGVTISPGTTFGVVDAGSVVSVWSNQGGSYSQILQAVDATFDFRVVGFIAEGAGITSTRLHNVRAPSWSATGGPKVEGLGVLPASPADDLEPRIVGRAPAGLRAEIFTSSTCYGLPVSEGTSAELASPGIPVTVADGTTTNFYVRTFNSEGFGSGCVGPVPYSELRSGALTRLGSDALANGTAYRKLPLLDVLQRYEPELLVPGTWTELPWGDGVGADSGGGWHGGETAPGAAIFWNPSSFQDAGTGTAAAVQLGSRTPPGAPGFSIWLDTPNPGPSGPRRRGYELRLARETGESFKVSIVRWQQDTGDPVAETVLASVPDIEVPTGSNVLFLDRDGTLAAWVGAASEWTEVISAHDTIFNSGYAGLSSMGTYLNRFRAGELMRLEPSPPRLETTVPASPSEDTKPHVLGATVFPGRTVSLFENPNCSGTPLAVDSKGKLNRRGPEGGIPIKVQPDTITNIYGDITDEAGYTSPCVGPVTYWSGSGSPTEAEAIAKLPMLDNFVDHESPLSKGGKWMPFGWWTPKTGAVDGNGWYIETIGPPPHEGGAYWAGSPLEEVGTGVGAVARMSKSPAIPGRSFSLWLNMPTPSGKTKAGYELRFSGVEKYEVTLSRWVAGTKTVLATATEVPLGPGGRFAIVHREGVLSAWVDNDGWVEPGTFTEILSAPDSTFESGYAGLSDDNPVTRLRSFKAGSLVLTSP
jgi:hypothetical protein